MLAKGPKKSFYQLRPHIYLVTEWHTLKARDCTFPFSSVSFVHSGIFYYLFAEVFKKSGLPYQNRHII